MTFDRQAAAKAAYASTSKKNPLNDFSDHDKQTMWALIKVTKESAGEKGGLDHLDRLHHIISEATNLADRLEDLLQDKLITNLFAPFLEQHTNLPAGLRAFASEIGRHLDLLGKPGHYGTVFTNVRLTAVSEFIKQKTGRYNDENLSELMQGVRPIKVDENFSGDAIRKRRMNLKKSYSAMYALAMEFAGNAELVTS
jgi:hypothetical protein